MKLMEFSPSLFASPLGWAAAVFFIVTGLACALMLHPRAVFISAVGVGMAGWMLLQAANVEYAVTDSRVLRRGGIFGKKESSIALRDIRDLRIHQTSLQKGMGLADLEVVSDSGTLILKGVDEPERVRSKIQSLI